MVLREYLLPQLNIPEDEDAFVCKKDGGYMTINTSQFSFLDCLLYLSPGTSLDGFLKAYASGDPTERKFWFPYEKMKSFEDLGKREMPVYSDYFSKLKGHNTLEAERLQFESMLQSGTSKEEALRKMDLKEEPATGQENYQTMVRVWEENNMETLEDLLR